MLFLNVVFTFVLLNSCIPYSCHEKSAFFLFLDHYLIFVGLSSVIQFITFITSHKIFDSKLGIMIRYNNLFTHSVKNGVQTIAPEENYPLVRVRVWVSVRVRIVGGGGNFPRRQLSKSGIIVSLLSILSNMLLTTLTSEADLGLLQHPR